jgi:hypothetical protein
MCKNLILGYVTAYLSLAMVCQTVAQPMHWSSNLKISPGFLGPNALPVPPMYSALNINKIETELALAAHFSNGDNTQNIFTRVYWPIADGTVALNLYVVPLETYQLSQNIIAERKLPSSKQKGIAGGDIYFSTIIQVFKDLKHLPDVTMSMNCRTASGTNLINGRYADTPGYWFDATMGRSVYNSNEGFLNEIRLAFMAGFYAWQTYRSNPQNDALLYGFRSDFKIKGIRLYQTVSGYRGRLDNHRDDPIVYRFFIEREFENNKIKLNFQKGIHDFGYSTIMISWSYMLDGNKVKTLPLFQKKV